MCLECLCISDGGHSSLQPSPGVHPDPRPGLGLRVGAVHLCRHQLGGGGRLLGESLSVCSVQTVTKTGFRWGCPWPPITWYLLISGSRSSLASSPSSASLPGWSAPWCAAGANTFRDNVPQIFWKFSKTFRKRRNGEKQKAKNNAEAKPEIEFQYAETYLKEIENCDEKLEDREENSSLENEKCQDYVTYQANNFTLMGSNYSRNIGYNSVSKTFIILRTFFIAVVSRANPLNVDSTKQFAILDPSSLVC